MHNDAHVLLPARLFWLRAAGMLMETRLSSCSSKLGGYYRTSAVVGPFFGAHHLFSVFIIQNKLLVHVLPAVRCLRADNNTLLQVMHV